MQNQLQQLDKSNRSCQHQATQGINFKPLKMAEKLPKLVGDF